MYKLRLTPCGTVDTTVTEFKTVAGLRHSLEDFARKGGYELHWREDLSGTLTTKCGRVNQATYTFHTLH